MEIYKGNRSLQKGVIMKYFYKTTIFKNNIFTISRFSIFFLFLLMLWSMGPWFAWNHTGIMVFALSGCFVLLRFILVARNYKNNVIVYSILVSIAFAFMVYFMVRLRNVGGLTGILNFIRLVVVFAFVLAMDKNEKKQIVTTSTTTYAWIVGVSMIAYLFVIAGVNLPYSVISVPDNFFYPPFLNYRLFIMSTNMTDFFFQRFQSIFTEPGHLSVISALFVYVNRYELKRKSVLIIFISVLLSLSLAGYVLMILGYLIQMVAKSSKVYKTVLKITAVTVLLIGMGFSFYVRNPDSVFSVLIMSRVMPGEDGNIQGWNRERANFIHFYETQFLVSTENILWGMNLSEAERWVLFGRGGNNSYRVFLLNNGVIALILLFLMYFSIVAITPSRLGFGLLLFCSVSFIQRIQIPFWEMQLFLFIGAMQFFNMGSYNKSSHKTGFDIPPPLGRKIRGQWICSHAK